MAIQAQAWEPKMRQHNRSNYVRCCGCPSSCSGILQTCFVDLQWLYPSVHTSAAKIHDNLSNQFEVQRQPICQDIVKQVDMRLNHLMNLRLYRIDHGPECSLPLLPGP